MAKILTDKELVDIISKAVYDEDEICCADSYVHFLEDLASLICDYFGGVPGTVAGPEDDLGYTIAIHVNDCVPSDGGIFKAYDTDVSWTDGNEQ